MSKPKQCQGAYETAFYDVYGTKLNSIISTSYIQAKAVGDECDAHSYIIKLIMLNSLEPKVTKQDYHK